MSKKKRSKLEDGLYREFESSGLPLPLREYLFHPVRKWPFDFAWPQWKIAIEIQGAIYTGGYHSRGAGYEKDNEKANTAALMGWRVFRFGPKACYLAKTKTIHSDAFAFMSTVIKRMQAFEKEKACMKDSSSRPKPSTSTF